jgi:hypothetical protein
VRNSWISAGSECRLFIKITTPILRGIPTATTHLSRTPILWDSSPTTTGIFYTWKARTTLYISMSEGTPGNFPDARVLGGFPDARHFVLKGEDEKGCKVLSGKAGVAYH